MLEFVSGVLHVLYLSLGISLVNFLKILTVVSFLITFISLVTNELLAAQIFVTVGVIFGFALFAVIKNRKS